MSEPATKRTTRAKTAAPAPEPEPEAPPAAEAATGHDGHGGCPVAWCPICITVTAVQPLRPDVIEHLLKAGTELLLAFKGVVDARAEEMTRDDSSAPSGPTRLEKIDLG